MEEDRTALNFDNGFYVADVIMGGGKSSAAINYINSAPNDERFVYLATTKPEMDRIVGACKKVGMIQPRTAKEKKDKSVSAPKLSDLRNIVAMGKNVTSSHALFERYDDNILENIKKHNYTLFLDEAYKIMRVVDGREAVGNLLQLCKDGYAEINKDTGEVIAIEGKEVVQGSVNEELLAQIRAGVITYCQDNKNGKMYIWKLPVKIVKAFKSVVVLTYMFEASEMMGYFEIFNIDYKFISTKRLDDGKYVFCSPNESNTGNIDYSRLIHIEDSPRLNKIGDKIGRRYPLSQRWYKDATYKDEMESLKSKLYSYANYRPDENDGKSKRIPPKDFMWATYCGWKDELSKGYMGRYKDSYVVWNERATNRYSHKHYLAYMVNPNEHPDIINYLKKNGVKNVDKDKWALSVMLQWIWRSAIRNGEEIYIYLPSARMRQLLQDWLDEGRRKVEE